MMYEYLYYDGEKITDYISNDLYTEAKKIIVDGGMAYMFPSLDMFLPSFWEQLITDIYMEELEADYDKGLEDHLTKLAKEKGKEVLEVEDAFDHLTFPAYYSYELQEYTLEALVEEFNDEEAREQARKDLKESLRMWASGDEQEIYENIRAVDEFDDIYDKRMYEEYKSQMITRRDHIMAEFIADALSGGQKPFVAVGLAHVVGPDSVSEILRQFGYTVEVVKSAVGNASEDTASKESASASQKPGISFAA